MFAGIWSAILYYGQPVELNRGCIEVLRHIELMLI